MTYDQWKTTDPRELDLEPQQCPACEQWTLSLQGDCPCGHSEQSEDDPSVPR